jgi:hypothetical protein
MVCSETNITFTGLDGQGQPLRWVWDLVGGVEQKNVVQAVTSNGIAYHCTGADYQLRLAPNAGNCEQLTNGAVRLSPNRSGKLVLMLGGF